jgi:TonB family protein
MNATATALAAWASACLLNALWQVALVFCAAWIAARLARASGAQAEHRVWVAALVAESVLPFCRLHPELWLQRLLAALASSGNGSGEVRMTQTAAAIADKPWLPAWAQNTLALVFLLVLLFSALRLVWNLLRTRELLRNARPIEPAAAMAHLLERYAAVLGVKLGRVSVLGVEELHGPATIGLFRHQLLLPADLVHLSDQASSLTEEEREEVATTLAHELVHIRRADYAWNLLYELVSLPFAWHPLLLLTRAQLHQTRELASDAEAALLVESPRIYARSLVRMAARIALRSQPCTLHAVGIYDSNIFERRIMHLMRKTEKVSILRRLAAVAACAVIALATCYTAMALQADVPQAQANSPKRVTISPGVAVGNLVSKVAPIYPPAAKQAGIQGTVVLSAVIGKDGHINDLKVVSGADELATAAMEAVHQWVYKPYLLNGEPVEVETHINVIYTLGGGASPAPTPAPSQGAANPHAAAAPDASLDTPPLPLTAIHAAFPPEAKTTHQEGVVIVTTKVDAEGHATVLATQGPDVFQPNARAAVEKVTFKPATRNGHPTEATVKIEVAFKYY